MILIATPRHEHRVPMLKADTRMDGTAVFQCVDAGGDVHVQTEHATFADALRQVAQRMDADAAFVGHPIYYDLEAC